MSYTDETNTQKNGINAGQTGTDFAHKVKSSAESMLDSGKHQFDTAMDATKTGMDQAQQFLSRTMNERPMTSTAIAMGVGLVVGMMIAGRR
jgi:ElaB/YqjD/DUF883 family membrane-anchored ribosome-binding protein